MSKENNMSSQEGVYTLEPRIYELGYLLMPTVNEGDLENEREALVALITKAQGIVISEGQPQLIDLSYDMDKIINNKRNTFSQGYFGWIKFDLSPELLAELELAFEGLESMLRSIVVKTVRENTIVSSEPFRLAKSNNSIEESDDCLLYTSPSPRDA